MQPNRCYVCVAKYIEVYSSVISGIEICMLLYIGYRYNSVLISKIIFFLFNHKIPTNFITGASFV